MKLFKKTIVSLAILLFFSFHFSLNCLPWGNITYAKADTTANITEHDPGFLAIPEKKIPVGPRIPGEKIEKSKMSKWLWVGLGALALGALASSSSHDDNNNNEVNSEPSTGDITIKWNE